MKKKYVAHKIAGLALACSTLMFAQAANAVVTSAKSEGYGLEAHVNVLDPLLKLNVGPLGDASGISNGIVTYADEKSAIDLSVSGDASVSGGLLNLVTNKFDVEAGVFNGEASYGYDAGRGAMTARGGGNLLNLDADASVIGLSLLELDLAGVNGTIVSEAEVWGDYGNWDTYGDSYIEDFSLDIIGLSLINANVLDRLSSQVNVELDASGKTTMRAEANTGIDLDVLGLVGVTLLLNEQVEVCNDSFCEMMVNAFRFSTEVLDGALASVGLTLGHSYARMEAAPSAVPVPAAIWLFGSGLMGLVGLSRRRQDQLSA